VRDLDSLGSPSSADHLHHDLLTIRQPPPPNNIRARRAPSRCPVFSSEPVREFRYIVPVARRLGANVSGEDSTIASL